MKKLKLKQAKVIFQKEIGTVKNIVVIEDTDFYQTFEITLGKINVRVSHRGYDDFVTAKIIGYEITRNCYDLDTLEEKEQISEMWHMIDNKELIYDLCTNGDSYIKDLLKTYMKHDKESLKNILVQVESSISNE